MVQGWVLPRLRWVMRVRVRVRVLTSGQGF